MAINSTYEILASVFTANTLNTVVNDTYEVFQAVYSTTEPALRVSIANLGTGATVFEAGTNINLVGTTINLDNNIQLTSVSATTLVQGTTPIANTYAPIASPAFTGIAKAETISAYEIYADAIYNEGEIIEYYTAFSGDLLTCQTIPVTAATISVYENECLCVTEIFAFFTGGTTNYSESASDLGFTISIKDQDPISSSLYTASFNSRFDEVRTYAYYCGGSASNLNSTTDFNVIIAAGADPDAGDRDLVIRIKYKILIIPSL